MLRRLLIGTAVLVALAVVGVAWATIPSKDGTINACFGNGTGIVRIIDSDSGKCYRWETPIFWNQTGPPGSQGLPGKSMTFTSAYSAHTSVPPGSFRFANAVCPAGTFVVTGGYATDNVSDAVLMPTNSYPVGMGDGRQAWYVVMRNLGTTNQIFWVWANCARLS